MTEYQKKILMKMFHAKPYLKEAENYQLAQSLNISEQRIREWFHNMRTAKSQNRSLHIGE